MKTLFLTIGCVLLIVGGILIGSGIHPKEKPVIITKIKTDTLVIFNRTLVMESFAQGWRNGSNFVIRSINAQGGIVYATPLNRAIQAEFERDTTIYNLLMRLKPMK